MDRYAVIGHPISHSKSPYIHTLFARQTQQPLVYEAIDLSEEHFEQELTDLFANGLKGCNVTIPFKERAFKFASQLTERAQRAGAVNTLKLTDDGILLGDNTDGAGLLSDLHNRVGELKGLKIALLGAGGAARGVLAPLLTEQPALVVIANRTASKAIQLAEDFSDLGVIRGCALDELAGVFDLIINATSASLSGHTIAIDEKLIHPDMACYDMMYSAGRTVFNQWAREHGARQVIDGLGMLVAQAAESFALWRGIRPGTRQVMNEIRRNFAL
ncbi:shikimate dehydrogenase [Celerinatantimonas sp. YJH-8]|uniref:shikimate dehydrogenase n=1 Tax=Celerinatantimonas sp. YJH-8 TaxID=3228714 RepID=UPI0038C5CBC6